MQINGTDCTGLTTADNALTSAGMVGIACGNVKASSTMDDCDATVRLDDFTFIAIIAAGGMTPAPSRIPVGAGL